MEDMLLEALHETIRECADIVRTGEMPKDTITLSLRELLGE